MKQVGKIMLTFLFAFGILASVNAQEEGAMPPMGAPDEIKEISWLAGEWDVKMSWVMAPGDTNWVSTDGFAEYSYSLDSCMLSMTFSSDFMGMPFNGVMYQTFDRHTNMFQTVWIDNMGARMSYYTGKNEGDSTVMSGNEIDETGKEVLGRITTYNETESKFDWKMEMSSDGGKTWWLSGKAVYTKKM